MSETTGRPEVQDLPVESPVERDGRVAERTECHGDRGLADDVVDDLVVIQNSCGIRPMLTIPRQCENDIVVPYVRSIRCSYILWIIDRWDAVAGGATLMQIDQRN